VLFDSGSKHLRVQRRAYFIVDCVHCPLVSVGTVSLKCRNVSFLHSCCSVLKRSKYSSLSSNHTKRHDDEGASSSEGVHFNGEARFHSLD
jgi:hypothetical protein